MTLVGTRLKPLPDHKASLGLRGLLERDTSTDPDKRSAWDRRRQRRKLNSLSVNRSGSIFKTGFVVMFHDFQITFLPAVDRT